MAIQFCHIAPSAYLEVFTRTNGAHLILAHLVETDEYYRNFYANLEDGKLKIMDNSAFEMYKQGRPMYPTDKLIEMGKACKANMIVMSDYPGQAAAVTIQAAMNTADEIKNAGFQTFYVPQSGVGDLTDYMEGLDWGLNSDLVNRIGLSILGCPNAYGVEKDNKLQRYMSRYSILKYAQKLGMLDGYKPVGKFHCLGMVDGPNEIELLRPFHPHIASWDSSAAVWAGLNGIRFDSSPTGLVNGKFELEVDFNHSGAIPVDILNDVLYNIAYIDELVKPSALEGVF